MERGRWAHWLRHSLHQCAYERGPTILESARRVCRRESEHGQASGSLAGAGMNGLHLSQWERLVAGKGG